MNFYCLSFLPNCLHEYENTFILIHDNWDDWFKYKTTYNLYFICNNESESIGTIKIGGFHLEDPTPELPNNFVNLPDEFFSLGLDDYYYEKIKGFGNERRIEILMALNDISYDLNLYDKVKNLDVTKSSLMRGVSEFSILNQFNRIAHGKTRLTKYRFEYIYPKRNGENVRIDFSVDPYSKPPTNIHVVVGRNNVGKTYLIKNVIKSIYNPSNNDFGTLYSGETEIDLLFANVIIENTKQVFANVICLSFSPFDDYEELRKAFSEEIDIPFSFVGLSNNIGDMVYEKLIADFKNSIENCRNIKSKQELLKNSLDILETDPTFDKEQLEKTIFDKKCNSEDIFSSLSSGHKMVMLSVVSLVDKLTEKSFVILDEPENHLHPPLLSAFIQTLSYLLKERNGVGLLSTHSPVVIQEVPRKCVWKITRNNLLVSPSRLPIETYGANIGALTSEVFGLEIRNSGFHRTLISEIESGLTMNEILAEYNYELGDEALALLNTLCDVEDY